MALAVAETNEMIPSSVEHEIDANIMVSSWSDFQEATTELICVPCEGELDLTTFKTQRCDGDGPASHDSKCCSMFHHRFDRRRPPTGYSPEPCEHEFLQEQGGGAFVADDHVICPFGDECGKCHNIVELLYHPQVFKRRLCMDMLDKGSCPRGNLCGFAHSRSELEAHATVFSAEEEQNPTEDFFMYRYKTQWCPQPGVHDWDACIYAHTKRDMRRTPNAGYGTRRCPDWEKALAAEPKDGPTVPYELCCPRGSGCHMAHGVKEVLYHPTVYRMKPCSGANSCRGPRRSCCAFAHSPDELRSPTKITQDKRMRAWAVNKEQPQFFVPLTFASFKDSAQKPAQPVPRTPSPQAYHRQIPCETEKSSGYCTEQALQQVLQRQSQNETLCPPPPPPPMQQYDQCLQQVGPSQECVLPSAAPFVAEQQHNWIEVAGSPCNVSSQPGFIPQSSPQAPPTPASGWRYVFDSQGNMHMWPENAPQSSSTNFCYDSEGNMHIWPENPTHSMLDLSPKAASYNLANRFPRSKLGDALRSDSMGSWGSSTTAPSTAPSTASYKYSSADSLRSESMCSWRSSSGSSDVGTHSTDPTPPKTSILGLFKEKLKPKPKGVVVAPRRFS